MTVIKVWGLPTTTKPVLNHLRQSIVNMLVKIIEARRAYITCLFPTDMMESNTDAGIVVEVNFFVIDPFDPNLAPDNLQILNDRLIETIIRFFPDTKSVRSFVSFNRSYAFWSASKQEEEVAP